MWIEENSAALTGKFPVTSVAPIVAFPEEAFKQPQTMAAADWLMIHEINASCVGDASDANEPTKRQPKLTRNNFSGSQNQF